MHRIWVVAATWLFVASAHAAPGDADRLFESGRELAHKGDWAGACEKFAQSYAIDPALGTQLNLADCNEHLGRARAAWELYTAAIVQSEKIGDDTRAQFAREHADAMAARLGTIVLDVEDPTIPGLAITIAGHRVEPAREVRDRADAGEVEIVATAPGHDPFTTRVRATAGHTSLVAIPATLAAAPATTPAPPPPPVDSDAHPDSARRGRLRLAWSFAAGAGASAITAVVIGAVARDDYDAAANGGHCTHATTGLVCDGVGASAIHHAQTLGDVATVFGVGAVALGVAATYVYLTAPREPVLAPVVSRKSVGLVWTRSF